MAFNWYSEEGQKLRTVLLGNHLELLNRAKINFLYANYLKYPDDERINEFLTKHYSFNVFRVACFRTSWIALSNLFVNKRNERFNLPVLIFDLKNSKYGVDVVPINLLEDWEEKIKLFFIPISDEFLSIRDKAFVHLDVDRPKKPDISLDYSHLKNLVNLAEEILMYLKNEVIGGGNAILYEEIEDLKSMLLKLATT